MNNLAKNLLFLRKHYNFKQAEMTANIGITRVTWSNYENGVTEPDIVRLLSISDLFKVRIDDIIRTDISKNVHLIGIADEKNDPKNVHPIVHPYVHPNETDIVIEPQAPYENALKKEVELLILRQLNAIAEDVKQIKGSLPPTGV